MSFSLYTTQLPLRISGLTQAIAIVLGCVGLVPNASKLDLIQMKKAGTLVQAAPGPVWSTNWTPCPRAEAPQFRLRTTSQKFAHSRSNTRRMLASGSSPSTSHATRTPRAPEKSSPRRHGRVLADYNPRPLGAPAQQSIELGTARSYRAAVRQRHGAAGCFDSCDQLALRRKVPLDELLDLAHAWTNALFAADIQRGSRAQFAKCVRDRINSSAAGPPREQKPHRGGPG
jgi:hypothetical protein